MTHDQDELTNVAANVLRDLPDERDPVRLGKLVERAARHYAELMVPEPEPTARELLAAASERGVTLSCTVCSGDESAGLPESPMICVQYGHGQAGPICTIEDAIGRLIGRDGDSSR